MGTLINEKLIKLDMEVRTKEEAIENYKMALQLSPDYVEAKDALGKMGIVQ